MKKATKILSSIGLVISTGFVAVRGVFAVDPPKLDPSLISKWVTIVMNILVPGLILVTFAMMIYGGYMWMMAAGDPGKVKQAQGTLTWAILGLVFVLLMKLIIDVVFGFIYN